MLVDDDPYVGKCLRELIDWERFGCEIIAEAFDGAEALKLAQETMPDVVITDVKMPVMNGLELCKQLREEMNGVTIIFLSGYDDFSTAQFALRYNVTDYILKPINSKKIIELSNILEKLTQSCNAKKYFDELLYEKETEICSNLESSNVSYFELLFQEISDYSVSNYVMVKEAAILLINILYRHFEDIGIKAEATGRRKKLDELQDMKNCAEIITFVKNHYFDVLQFSIFENDDYYRELIVKMEAYIATNYKNPNLDISDIANHFKFSTSYIMSFFPKHAGVTLNVCIMNIRMEKAEALLCNTVLSINDIAQMTGFIDQNYFTRVFKKQNNLTPTAYRNKNSLIMGGEQ